MKRAKKRQKKNFFFVCVGFGGTYLRGKVTGFLENHPRFRRLFFWPLASLVHPWCILGASLVHPWCILGASLVHPWWSFVFLTCSFALFWSYLVFGDHLTTSPPRCAAGKRTKWLFQRRVHVNASTCHLSKKKVLPNPDNVARSFSVPSRDPKRVTVNCDSP